MSDFITIGLWVDIALCSVVVVYAIYRIVVTVKRARQPDWEYRWNGSANPLPRGKG